MQILYITGNDYKFRVAQESVKKSGITLVQQKLETPEIQSDSVQAIAEFSARWACERLQRPVAVTDAGYYIAALNGFPGPFIKYMNHWLTANDYLRLMDGKKDRSVIVKTCLVYCKPGDEPVTFIREAKGLIAEQAGPKGETSINELFIPEGFQDVASALPETTMTKFWSQTESHWQELATYLASSKNIRGDL